MIDLNALAARSARLRALTAGSGRGEPMSWRIRAAADRRAQVYLYGAVDGWEVDGGQLAQEIRALDVDAIDLRINSPGGDYFDAVAVFGALVEHPATVDGYVDGLAASAASFILQAAGRRVMARSGRVMVHDARVLVYGPPAALREAADVGDAISDDMADLYAARAGGTRATWRATMARDRWYSAAESVTAGLADEVADPPADQDARAAARASTLIRARHRVRTTARGEAAA